MGNLTTKIGIGLLIFAILLMFIFPVLALAVVGSISGSNAQACSTSTLPGSGATTPKPDNGSGPPAKFIPIYQAAAAKYHLGTKGPSVLAGIHSAETGFGDSNGDNQTSTAGAQGPMQFLPSTWSTYGVDGNNDGTKDINNVNDAIFGAARYLRASGAPKDWHSAILSYNNAEWYYQEVWNRAKKYDVPATGDATAQDNTGDCTPNGSDTPSGTCDATQVEYLPQYSLDQFASIFGKPRSKALDNQLTNIDFMGTNVQVHKKVAPCLEAVAADWKAQNIPYKVRMMGCYRPSDGGGTGHIGDASYHVYGAACDINWDTNGYGAPTHDMPPEVVKIFRNHGFLWGGDYAHSTPDWMHFEWHGVRP